MDLAGLERTFRIPDYANMIGHALGLDSRDHCLDRRHFDAFGPVSYRFNSLGYRMAPPESFTGREILALGDSFTLGLGVDIEHTWTTVLGQYLDHPILNFSLNGASNQWMARRLSDLLRFFSPPLVLVHYSFSHRRENDRPDWFDNERTLSDPSLDPTIDLDEWAKCSRLIHELCAAIPVIESFIPRWHEPFVDYAQGQVPPIAQIDRARDGFHYGPQSHVLLARTLYQHITNLPVALSHQFL